LLLVRSTSSDDTMAQDLGKHAMGDMGDMGDMETKGDSDAL